MINRIASLVDKGKIEMTTGEVPRPAANEVLIKVKHCGICGSDIHNFQAGGTGKRVIHFPFVLGHEFAGEVVETGADVKTLAVGDRVCVEPGVACGECRYCKSGRYNLCEDMRFMSAYPNRGSMQGYVVFPAKNCFKLPENLTTVEGALIEPLAVGLHAVNRGNVRFGDTVVIMGTGCIGIMTLLACKAKGATRIIAVDIFNNRLQKANGIHVIAAMYFGTRNVISKKTIESPEDFKNLKLRVGTSKMWNFTAECLGASATNTAWSEVYTALSGGVADACESPSTLLYSSKVYEVCKNLVKTEHLVCNSAVIMSEEVYQSLPDVAKQAIDTVGKQFAQATIELTSSVAAEYDQKLVDEGVKIVEIDKTPFIEYSQKNVEAAFPEWSENLYQNAYNVLFG